MQHAVVQREPELFAPPPIKPWEYIRMRRHGAGLKLEQAAKFFYQREEHRAGCEANLRLFEMPGVIVKRIDHLDLQRAFPFDNDVYRALAELRADRHPTLCRRCGWDRWTEQPDREDYLTTWSTVLPDHCTRCEQDARRQGKL